MPDMVQIFKKIRRKFLWKSIYNTIYSLNDGSLFQTLNYGYAYSDTDDGIRQSGSPILPPKEIYGHQLYSKVLSYCSVQEGVQVLEVGCGTGYGLANQAVLHPEAGFTGLDFSSASIKRAKSTFTEISNLIFVNGNAMDLPFESETFDILFNIESSHCYPDKEAFFSEAQRVLKPGGTFLIADFRMPENYENFLMKIQKNFILLEEIDITKNVLKSLKKLTPMRKEILDIYFKNRRMKEKITRRQLERWAGMEGSITFERFKEGYWKYFICTLKKG